MSAMYEDAYRSFAISTMLSLKIKRLIRSIIKSESPVKTFLLFQVAQSSGNVFRY